MVGRTVVAGLLASVVVAPLSAASTVSLTNPHQVGGDEHSSPITARDLSIVAAPGEINAVSVAMSSPQKGIWTIRDQAGATAGEGCRQGAQPTVVTCHGWIDATRIDLGDGDDRLLRLAAGGAIIDGGTGNDVIDADPAGSATINGGAGDDRLYGRSVTADGGPGADVMIGSGTVSYHDRTAPVTVTLDGEPNDGEAGER